MLVVAGARARAFVAGSGRGALLATYAIIPIVCAVAAADGGDAFVAQKRLPRAMARGVAAGVSGAKRLAVAVAVADAHVVAAAAVGTGIGTRRAHYDQVGAFAADESEERAEETAVKFGR